MSKSNRSNRDLPCLPIKSPRNLVGAGSLETLSRRRRSPKICYDPRYYDWKRAKGVLAKGCWSKNNINKYQNQALILFDIVSHVLLQGPFCQRPFCCSLIWWAETICTKSVLRTPCIPVSLLKMLKVACQSAPNIEMGIQRGTR